MPFQRRRRGFELAGALPLDRLGLPRARARQLLLAQAWERVAGPALAARAQVLRIQRGVLEIEVEPGRWSETLGELLPGLVGRLSGLCPELGVRRFRLVRADPDERETPRAIEIRPVPGESSRPQDAPQAQVKTQSDEDRRPQKERLEELARRYVERGADQNQ